MKSRPRIHWKMSKGCNFGCSYCGCKNKYALDFLPIEAITETLKKLGKEWVLIMLGGEPLLHPNFVEICKIVTKSNNISIITNLSITSKVKDFAESIDPDKV